MKKIVATSILASTVLMAGGWKIPEASLNAVALGAANVAHSNGADAAYYNPANMAFSKDKKSVMELDLMYIGLSEIQYSGTYGGSPIPNSASEKETFLVPSFHYVSPEISGARFGLSVVVPAGLSKRWKSAPGIFSAEEFTLEAVEINPTVALPINDKLAVAIGFRVIHSSGVVKSQGLTVPNVGGAGVHFTNGLRDMTGDSIDMGYNLALAYKPNAELEIGVTYRSNIDLSVEGDAKLSGALGGADRTPYNGSASVTVPVPALLNVAMAYTFKTKTTVEFVYERNYWHTYKNLDFDYGDTIDPVLGAVFGTSLAKNWKDTDVYRLGITQELDKLTLMGGVVIDETPIPDETIGFELPDSDSLSLSFGGRYQVNDKINIGLSALYSMRDDRKVSTTSLDGEFTGSNVLLVSVGMEYKF